METHKEKLAEKIENRLQFIITILVIFLATVRPEITTGSIIIAACIVDYIFLAYLIGNLSERHLKWLNNSIFIGLGSYVIPLAVIALAANNTPMPTWMGYFWLGSSLTSALLIVLIPIIILVIPIGFGLNWRKIFSLK